MAKRFETRTSQLNGHAITRVLPRAHRRMVGPFIFIDIMGPLNFAAGEGLDVPPHPHIGLSTLTYLFSGALLHRDSLGNVVEIRPGEVNWMTAGEGIVHSERQTADMKADSHSLFGMQCWVASPAQQACASPAFFHQQQNELPLDQTEQRSIRIIAGSAYGMQASITEPVPMFFVDVSCHAHAQLEHPQKNQEAMLYLVEGSVVIGDEEFQQGEVALLETDDKLQTTPGSRFLLLGGEAWPEQPFIDWNFVAFDKARIEQAKTSWRNGDFPLIPGDSDEAMPLPE